VDAALQACHPYRVEQRSMRNLCAEIDVPYIAIETDYSSTDAGQMNTRISAFIEMIGE